MNNPKPRKPEEYTAPLSGGDPRIVQAIITKVADGYTVTVSLKTGGRTHSLAESTVDSYADAEAVAKAFAARQEFPWYKVVVSSR
jgi:hypothetical protein